MRWSEVIHIRVGYVELVFLVVYSFFHTFHIGFLGYLVVRRTSVGHNSHRQNLKLKEMAFSHYKLSNIIQIKIKTSY